MARFNWNSRKEVESLMRHFQSGFSRWSEVRELTDEELDLWVSIDYYFVTHDGFYPAKQLLYNYCNDLS